MKTVETIITDVQIKGPISKTTNGKERVFYVKTLVTTKGNFIEYQNTPEIVEQKGDKVKIATETKTTEFGEENLILKVKLLKRENTATTETPPWHDSVNQAQKGITNLVAGLDTTIKTITSHLTTTGTPMNQQLKFFKITGKLHYAHIKEKDTKGKFPTNKYKTDLIVDTNTAKNLAKLGVLVKTREGVNGQFVTMKSTFQPTVTDLDGNQVVDIPLMGNGTEVLATVALYDNKAPNGGKKCLGMNAVQIQNLVQYEAPLLSDLDISE